MNDKPAAERKIHVPILTRVEGEGALNIVLSQSIIQRLELNIYEPPRFFEAFLNGRSHNEVADITARICGICPIAYQMTAIQAIESAWGIEVPEHIYRLRRLMYFAEWIESHGLHIHLLHAPDFFDCNSGLDLAKIHPMAVQRGLRLKKIGNQVLEVLGGRAIHPISLAVGGFYRLPRREELDALIPQFQWGLEASIEMTRWISGFSFPEFSSPTTYVALQNENEYAIMSGRVASSDRTHVTVGDYEKHFYEEHVPHSTALHSHRVGDARPYQVGPLARVHLNFDQLTATARRLASEVNWSLPTFNPYHSIIARAVELVHAFEEGLEILKSVDTNAKPRIGYTPSEASGCAITEAPRGLIYHRYELDESGNVKSAKIVPPTSQNQRQIEQDLYQALPALIAMSDEQVARRCETLIRNYDPCISCSTHFLKVRRTQVGE
jgi:coenzyme F420-reducing hydrogenase alpha subunit